ncbi:hypothetical protein ACTXT7_013863 [Hymenolepis weldensis]
MDLNTRLPPIPEKRITQAHSPSMSFTSGDKIQTENKSSPKVAPRRNILLKFAFNQLWKSSDK